MNIQSKSVKEVDDLKRKILRLDKDKFSSHDKRDLERKIINISRTVRMLTVKINELENEVQTHGKQKSKSKNGFKRRIK